MSVEYKELPFYAWQSNVVLGIQKMQSPFLNVLFDVVEMGTKGPLYPMFIFGTMIMFDFLLGYQMAVLLAFNVIVSLNLKYWIRGGRPFWTNRDVVARECHVQTFGFPSGHVQAPTVLMLFFWLYLRKYQLKTKPRVKRILVWTLGICFFGFLFLAGFSRLYVGVHFIHDLAAGYFFGVLIVAFHILALVPLVVRPLARYVVNGKLTQFFHVMLIALLASFSISTMCILSTTLPLRLLNFPDQNWKIISNSKCSEPISAFSGYQDQYFLLLGFLYGTCFGIIYCLKYKPFVSHTQSLIRRVLRLLFLGVIMLPCVGVYLIESMILKKKMNLASEVWSFVDMFLGLLGGLYFILVGFPLLERLNLMEVDREVWNEAMVSRIKWFSPGRRGLEEEEQPISTKPVASYDNVSVA